MRAVIPARKGSNRLPYKNRRYVGDRHLVEHAVESARGCPWFKEEDVIVATNDPMIKAWCREEKICKHHTDEAQRNETGSMLALHDVLDYDLKNTVREHEWYCLLQPTSPLRTSDLVGLYMKKWNDYDRPKIAFSTTDGETPCGCWYIFHRSKIDQWDGEGEPLRIDHRCVDIDYAMDLRKARRAYRERQRLNTRTF